jgi:hypothetical protein
VTSLNRIDARRVGVTGTVENGVAEARRRRRGRPHPIGAEAGRFPVEAMMPTYDFDQIDQAAHDAGAVKFVKPVIRMR